MLMGILRFEIEVNNNRRRLDLLHTYHSNESKQLKRCK